MVCSECNGTGKTVYFVEVDRDENSVTCEKKEGICRTCNGRGEKTMTNGDKIQAMSDKELACFLAGKFTDFTTQRKMELGEIRTATAISAETNLWYAVWMQWLRMPVEDV